MVKPIRLSATLTAIGLVGALAACSTTGSQHAMTGSTLFGKIDSSNIGLATKAQIALASNDVPTAVALAERAVGNSPKDAGFRALLGNCYLAAGRFASAEQAYSDSLSLVQNQPQVVLKLALAQIALGKGDNAAMLIASASSMIDASDAGLALALAGHADQAIAVLEPAARDTGADARIRQNLALAYAFAGNWDSARTIAAQDVPGDQLDARIKDWMKLATPGQPTTKIASFLGVTPAASDAGQPTRLALIKLTPSVQQAEAAPPAPVMPDIAPPPAPEQVAVPIETVAQIMIVDRREIVAGKEAAILIEALIEIGPRIAVLIIEVRTIGRLRILIEIVPEILGMWIRTEIESGNKIAIPTAIGIPDQDTLIANGLPAKVAQSEANARNVRRVPLAEVEIAVQEIEVAVPLLLVVARPALVVPDNADHVALPIVAHEAA